MDDKMKLLEQLAEKYARRFNSSQGYDGDSLSPEDRIEMRAYVEGFKAHQELVKDKFILSKDDIEKIIHAAMVFEFNSGSIDLGVSVLTSAIIKSLLPPTEWNVKINEQGKLELL